MRTKPQSSQDKMSWAGMLNTLAGNHVVKLLTESLCVALNRIPAGFERQLNEYHKWEALMLHRRQLHSDQFRQ